VSDVYKLVNVYDKDNKWYGQFIDEQTAKDWLKKKGYAVDQFEISNRKLEWKRSES